jgi:DHA1 family multidrug resistance protein-like MFS transporter
MGFTFVFPFIPLFIQKELHVTSVREVVLWAGVSGAATGVALAIMSPIWGALADRHGRKPMVVRAMIGGGCTIVAIAFVSNVQQFVVLRILQGALAGTIAASTALVATEAPRDRVSSSLGLLQSGVFIGSAAGPLFGGIVSAAVGLRGSFVVSGLILLAAGVLAWRGVHEHFRQYPLTARTRTGLRALAGPALAIVVVLLLVQVGSSGAYPILPLLITVLPPVGGASPSFLAGTLFGLSALAATAGALTYGRLTERFGLRSVLIAASLAGGIFAVLQGTAQNYLQLLLLTCLAGGFQGVIGPLLNLMLQQEVPYENRARAFGVGASATAIGGAAGPLMAAGLAAASGLRWAIAATGLVLLAMTVWCIAVVREPPAAAARTTAG